MNEEKELRIRILPDAGRIIMETCEDGIISCKEIQTDAFLSCIYDSIRHDTVSSGFLPPNCLYVRIYPDGGKDYGLWYPEVYADIRYHETAYPHFPLPRLVFAFHADPEGKISKCRMGVVADERPTPETKMYIYPFSNVSGRYGKLCIGANALPQYKKPHTLANLPTLSEEYLWSFAAVFQCINRYILTLFSLQNAAQRCLRSKQTAESTDCRSTSNNKSTYLRRSLYL